MKKILLVILLTCLIFSCAKQQPSSQPALPAQDNPLGDAAELSFNYTRLGGVASNQFAIWVEDAGGNFIKTLYATRWTADGGWKRRPSSIPMWVQKAGVASFSQAEIDTVSGATPRTGRFVRTWDGTDSRGASVQDGDYVIFLEGTLRWENQVYYRIPIRLGDTAPLTFIDVEYIGDADKDREMINDVTVRVLR